ncbi:MAG: ABC transporter substrate-binding protein [Candidatus Tectomicrobia bacterium]|nr:ABC transporter substrate-binding protein [Candidatus Tectomicrobia bacterium]
MLRKGHLLYWTLFTLLGLAFLGRVPQASAADGVSFILDWVPYGKHAPFYLGVDKGIYKQYGLDVKVLSGKGSGLSIKSVGAKGVEYAHADAGSLILARANEPNLRVKLIAMLHHNPLFNVVMLAKSPINSPKDLEGKKVGSPVVNSTRIVFPAFAELAKFDPNKVVWVDMEASAQNSSLFAERVDAIASYATQIPPMERMAQQLGKPIKSITFADYGLDVYSNGIIAHEDIIKNQSSLTRRFIIASLEAVKWSVEHPQEAIDVFLKHHPNSDRYIARGQFNVSVDVLLTKETMKTGIGFMNRDKMERTIDLMVRFYKGLKRKPSPEEIYTNEFVAVFPAKPKNM